MSRPLRKLIKLIGQVAAKADALRKDQSGVSMVVTALMMPLLIGFTGLSLDIGVWQIAKRDLQGAVDQAVFSAASAAGSGASVDQAKIEAKAVMAENGFVNGQNGVAFTISNPATEGNFKTNAASWEIKASKTANLYFSTLFLSTEPTINVRAAALQGTTVTTLGTSTTTPGKGCILTLDTTAQYATEITNNGSSSNSGCAIYTNSNNAKALGCYNNCTITGDTYTVGNYYKSGTMSGTNKIGQTAQADPYASLTTPTATEMGTTCANSNAVVKSTSAASLTISPGRYCKGINFTGSGKTLIMQAGTYYVESIFNVGTGATLDATAGVTIVIVGSYCLGDTNNTCQHPDEGIGNTANVNITAPTTGTYAGVAMYFSNATYRSHAFANNAYLHIQGMLYAPNQRLQFNNNSSFDSAKCTKIIASRVSIQNNGNMSSGCTNTGVKTIGDTTTTSPGTTTTTPSSMVE